MISRTGALWFLRAGLLAAGLLIVIRAAAGPFHSLVSVSSPLVAEGVFAFALFACLALQSGVGPGAGNVPRPSPILLVILVFTAVCFLPGLSNYFLSDDFQMLDFYRRYAPTLPLTWSFTRSSSGGVFFRPVASLASSLVQAWAGESPFRWHAADLAIHLLNCTLVYLVALSLFAHRAKAAWSAALFGVFPASPEAVSWPAGGHDTLIATLFVLATVELYALWIARRGAALLAAGLLACVLALGSKEIAFALPLVLGAVAWHQRARLRTVAPFLGLAAVVFAYRWYVLGGAGGYDLVHATPLGAAKALTARIWTILAMPVNWSVKPRLFLVLALAAGVCAYAALTFSRPVRRDLALAVIWILALSAPAIQMLLIGADLLNSRHLYLPAAGLAMLLGGAVEELPKWRCTAGAALLVFYASALEHNLAIRGRVSEAARETCVAAANGARVTDPPAILDGVWMFSNGFDVCVEMQKKP